MLNNSDINSLIDEFYAQQYIITDYQLQPYNIRLTNPWKTASSQFLYRQGLLVSLSIDGSSAGIGECAPMPEISTETLAQAQNYFFHEFSLIKGKVWKENLLSDLKLLPACRFALESILLNFIARQQNTSIAHLCNNNAAQLVKTNIMLGALDKKSLVKARHAEQQGFSCLKFKLGINDLKTDLYQLQHLLEHIHPDTIVRLDANKSWSFKQTQWLLKELQSYHQQIDSIEEPLLNYDRKNYQNLQGQSPIHLALDESFSSTMTFEQFPLKRLVLKPMAQGGIINTLKLAKLSQQQGIETIISSAIETGYGLEIISQCCAAINNDQYHGIATATWLEDTLIEPPVIQQGHTTIKEMIS